MNEISFAVTVGRNGSTALPQLAKNWAKTLGVAYIERADKGNLETIRQTAQVEALLVATNLGPQIYTSCGKMFFHPSMAVLRLQRLKNGASDHLVTAMGLKPGMRVLDCTLGLASDAVIASYIVGATGAVYGLEASLLLHFIVTQGLESYKAEDQDMNVAMRRIKTLHTEAYTYLQTAAQNSFDVIYFDPMFRFPVQGSSNMEPLRPIAYERPLNRETIELALKIAPRVVIKERSKKVLLDLGCDEISGGRYSKVHYGIKRR